MSCKDCHDISWMSPRHVRSVPRLHRTCFHRVPRKSEKTHRIIVLWTSNYFYSNHFKSSKAIARCMDLCILCGWGPASSLKTSFHQIRPQSVTVPWIRLHKCTAPVQTCWKKFSLKFKQQLQRKCFFLCFFSCEDLLMPTTPTEGGIAWSLEIRSTKQGQKSSTRDQRKSVNMSIGSHSKHSAGHRKRWSFVSRPQFDNSCLAFMNDTNDRTLRPCISWQSREIEMFQGEIVLWANWKHVGSARAIYEQLR